MPDWRWEQAMAEQGEQRMLAAIFAADIVGYSRLMEADERGPIARLKVYRTELIDPKIAEHHGRIVKNIGDGISFEEGSGLTPCASNYRG